MATKKIDMKKSTKESRRMATFSRKKKELFKENEEFESITGSRVASVVFSLTGRLHTYGDVDSAIQRHFPSTKQSTPGTNSPQFNCNAVGVVSDGSSGLRKNGLRDWVEGIDVEKCQNLNQLLLLKEQLEGTKEKIGSINDAESFEALFV